MFVLFLCVFINLLGAPLSFTFFLRMKAEEERQKKEDEKARREFIKQEYLRRKQLKLMEDMDTVIKPRPAGSKQKKPRPKSIHRDSLESSKAGAGNPGHSLARSLFPALPSGGHLAETHLQTSCCRCFYS